MKSQKLRRNFQAWRAVGSNDLFDAAWLLEADVGFLHLGYDDFSGANFSGGSVILIVDNGSAAHKLQHHALNLEGLVQFFVAIVVYPSQSTATYIQIVNPFHEFNH